MTTVLNIRDAKADVYIGRGSKWGNPFKMESEADRDKVCEQYEAYFWSKGLFKDIAELVDKTLGCYCKPKRCHGDFLADCANFYAQHGYLNKSEFEASRKEASQSSSDAFYLLVAGSRTFTNQVLFADKMSDYIKALNLDSNTELVIIHGGARGADTLAGTYAKDHKIKCQVFKANWNEFGKSAGYRRNEQMHQFIAQHPNRACICFWDGQSKGTAHNFDLAKKFNTKLDIVRIDETVGSQEPTTSSEPVMEFRNEYWFLSNFYPCSITDSRDGLTFECVESAFQASKCANPEDRKRFVKLTGAQAKKLGRQIKLRDDWDSVKVDLMREFVSLKFSNAELKAKLRAIKGDIVENNYWNDTFWGVCKGKGENHLGKILMQIRDSNVSKPKELPKPKFKMVDGKYVRL